MALIAGRLDEAANACYRAQHGELAFRQDANSSASALQSYMVRREAGRLESVRPLISGDESPTDRWAPGLLAIYTELQLRDPGAPYADWLLDHSGPESVNSNDGRRASCS